VDGSHEGIPPLPILVEGDDVCHGDTIVMGSDTPGMSG
jgi:hypothetical protein